MKDYRENGKVYEITLDNGKVVKCATEWVNRTIKALDTDLEDVLLMFLEDNGYMENEELEELDSKAKTNKVKIVDENKPKAKTPRQRTQKPQPEKEYLVGIVAEFLEDITDITNLNIENKAKLITFTYKNVNYSFDLVQKRAKKE